MAAGDTIGQSKCACSALVPIKESKNGGLSGTCPGCGAITWYKTPKSVAHVRATLAAAAAPAARTAAAPAAKPAERIRAALGESFDLGKL
jgi:hypothetical protein